MILVEIKLFRDFDYVIYADHEIWLTRDDCRNRTKNDSKTG